MGTQIMVMVWVWIWIWIWMWERKIRRVGVRTRVNKGERWRKERVSRRIHLQRESSPPCYTKE